MKDWCWMLFWTLEVQSADKYMNSYLFTVFIQKNAAILKRFRGLWFAKIKELPGALTPALPQQGVALDPANFSVLAVLPTFTHAGLRLEFRVSSVSPIPVEGFSLNFGQMFALVRRCAESITTMPTQDQSHSSGSWVWALNFMSALYLLYSLEDFL